MRRRFPGLLPLAAALLLAGAPALAQQEEHRPAERPAPAAHPAPHPAARPAPHPMARAAPPHGEPHPGPQAYQRVAAPAGAMERPKTFDKVTYQHNYQAARSYKIGPYHPPRGWVARRWVFGQILPRPFWVAQYIIADYWLFGLEVPPIGYEWVRYGPDALLVNTTTGEILEAEYGVFA
jgi:Ni/Co efflux regulator RcnB